MLLNITGCLCNLNFNSSSGKFNLRSVCFKMSGSQGLLNFTTSKHCTNAILLISQDIVYPRKCEFCKRVFISKEAFSSHKKRCADFQLLQKNTHQLVSYPRQCHKCVKMYKSKSSFCNHKQTCSLSADSTCHSRSAGSTCCSKVVYPRQCDQCLRTYKSKTSFSNHKKTCSAGGTRRPKTYPRQCGQCLKTYKCRSSFYSHKKRCSDGSLHFKEIAVSSLVKFHEGKKFYQTSVLQKGHRRGLNISKVFNCLSPGCESAFLSAMSLSLHLKYMHGMDDLKKLSFDNMAGFERWLEIESTKTFSSFKKITGHKKKGNKLYGYYACQFSNPSSSQYPRKSSRRNSKGTIPFDINCPSRMYICQEEGGSVSVSYHYMHNHSLVFENCKFQQLKKSARDLIRANLRLHVPIKKIQELLKEEAAARVNGEIFPVKEAFVTCKNIASYRRYICNATENDASSGEHGGLADCAGAENCEFKGSEQHSVEVCEKLTAELLELIRTHEVQNHGLDGICLTLKRLVAQCRSVVLAEKFTKEDRIQNGTVHAAV